MRRGSADRAGTEGNVTCTLKPIAGRAVLDRNDGMWHRINSHFCGVWEYACTAKRRFEATEEFEKVVRKMTAAQLMNAAVPDAPPRNPVRHTAAKAPPRFHEPCPDCWPKARQAWLDDLALFDRRMEESPWK